MYHVELYARVRRACMVEGMSLREASRVFGLAPGHGAQDAGLLGGAGLPAAESTPPPQPFDKLRMRPCTGVIDRILESDLSVPRKQRHTAKRIFERRRDEYGFGGQYTIVKD